MEIKRTFDILDNALKKASIEDAFTVKRNNNWEKFSTEEVKKKADYFSSGLLELGLIKGDKILTVSNNRPEWHIADTGMLQIGAIHVPVYPTLGKQGFDHLFRHSEAKMLIVSSEEKYRFTKPIADNIGSLEHIYTFDTIDGISSFDEIISLGERSFDQNKGRLQQMKMNVSESDVCSIIYTSGTTGEPKGVMLTHKNIVSNVIASAVSATPDIKKAISFLPLNHVFERMMNYLYIHQGVSIYYAESTETLVDDIQEIKPDTFASVPRLLEKIYDKIYSKGLDLKGIKKSIFFSSLRSGQKYNYDKTQNVFLKAKIALDNKLVFSKWREALGGNIKMIISSGASLQPRLTRVFGAAKIPIIEGYGLTESSPTIAVNRPNDINPGTVGRLLDISEVKIAKDGEVLFKGPCLMKGYYKDKEKTNEAIDENGWFHTGDMGELKGDILKITGRKKELFKLSTGQYVSPQLVENIMKETPFIDQILVVGENERFCSAIICPSFEHLSTWAEKHEIKYSSNIDLVRNTEVINKYQSEIEDLNFDIVDTMKIKKFALVCQEWGPDTGELSPTLKLKRHFLMEKYQTKVKFLYGDSDDKGDIES